MPSAPRSIVIHGHFYQPPREDPWLGEVEVERSAAPYHDWNERITQECYRAVVAARVLGEGHRITKITNLLAATSFDFGPTLLEWMEHEAPDTYAAILAADRLGREALGTGGAMAMPYHHAILPLCSRRDKVTEVRWGIADFRRRFGREPEGMWLPETAVDEETLDVLAAEGIRFTVLAPHQVETPPADGLPLAWRASGGRTLALFVYHGPLSHDIAFGPLLHNASVWHERLMAEAGAGVGLISMATDGETYGHHHRFGEMALAALLEGLVRDPRVRVENFGSFLARHPPRKPAAVVSPSSWSCSHGVERWRSDCGCRMDPNTHQRWRGPLRDALSWLADQLHERFEAEGGALLGDPWRARDEYENGQPAAPPSGGDPVRARELLEMERNCLRMFTSCGWFFNDIAGIETVQVLRYAARAIDLAGDPDGRLEAGLEERLAQAPGNEGADGRMVYQGLARPAVHPARRAAAGFRAIRELDPSAKPELKGYDVRATDGCVGVRDRRTGRDWCFLVAVERPSLAAMQLAVSESRDDRPATVTLDGIPERHRRLVTPALMRAVAGRWLTPAALDPLAGGAPAELFARALVTAVEMLERDESAAASARVLDLADLLSLLGRSIPFDAQTRFYRIWSAARPDRAAALATLAWRLGFGT
jgi:hypothetical protein